MDDLQCIVPVHLLHTVQKNNIQAIERAHLVTENIIYECTIVLLNSVFYSFLARKIIICKLQNKTILVTWHIFLLILYIIIRMRLITRGLLLFISTGFSNARSLTEIQGNN